MLQCKYYQSTNNKFIFNFAYDTIYIMPYKCHLVSRNVRKLKYVKTLDIVTFSDRALMDSTKTTACQHFSLIKIKVK